ncbi:filamentous hemagglutinin family outer membrane protein [Gloeomargarita lithophora Alchichica-D10]|uniref:Filamentous hemagglutinin family outer membrane protein n=1 Tax=Gloeomargarita lithophora Alchichica-D10 TaxID=1188229 RepID=A0A1J0AF72_9CYAN|nr:filamentous hemagglutinin family outer membrane protein [Gloeomargarita lithophora Alchichica-D10]
MVNSGVEIKNTSTNTGFDAIVFNANTAGTATGNFVGIKLDNSTLITQGGNILLTGTGGNTGGDNYGIHQRAGAEVTSTSGNITYTGEGGNGTFNNFGVNVLDTNTKIFATTGEIKITGNGGGNGTGSSNYGIVQGDGAKVSTTTGNITYTGTGGNGTGSGNFGIFLSGATQVTSTNGGINYTGTGTSGADAIRIGNGDITIGDNTTGKITFTSTNNVIIFKDVTVKTTNNITITSPASVTQNNVGGLFASGLELLGNGLYALTNTNNDVATLAANTTNTIKYTDTNGFEIGTVNATNGINTTGNVTLTAQNTVTQTQAITADGLALLGTGDVILTEPSNLINIIAADITGDLKFVNSQTLTVGIVNPDGIENANSVFLQALTGDIIVNKSITATNDITLVADDNFINNVGVTALTSGGTFLVYATSPQDNVNGWAVLGGLQQFKTTFPQPALFIGNGFLYKVGAPLIPGLPNSSFTESVTFTLNFNDRQWRDLSDMGEAVLFPEALLCVNVPVNQASASTPLTEPLVLRTENLPSTNTQWQTGDFPACPSSD